MQELEGWMPSSYPLPSCELRRGSTPPFSKGRHVAMRTQLKYASQYQQKCRAICKPIRLGFPLQSHSEVRSPGLVTYLQAAVCAHPGCKVVQPTECSVFPNNIVDAGMMAETERSGLLTNLLTAMRTFEGSD
jgi:hypothetical protein